MRNLSLIDIVIQKLDTKIEAITQHLSGNEGKNILDPKILRQAARDLDIIATECQAVNEELATIKQLLSPNLSPAFEDRLPETRFHPEPNTESRQNPNERTRFVQKHLPDTSNSSAIESQCGGSDLMVIIRGWSLRDMQESHKENSSSATDPLEIPKKKLRELMDSIPAECR